MFTTLNKLKSLKLLGLSCLASFSLTACLPDQIDMSEYEDTVSYQSSQGELYANSLMQYAIKAQAALIDGAAWEGVSSGLLEFGTGPFADVRMGGSEGYVASALCRDGASAVHFTWFEAANSDGEVALKGLGRGSGADLMSSLSKTVNGDQLAVMTASDGLRATQSGTEISIPASCGELNIPHGSPVMVFALATPEEIDRIGNVVSYEYRTRSCGEDEDGNLLDRRSVTYNEGNDAAIYGGWTQIENNCRAEVDNEDMDVADMVNEDAAFAAADLSALSASGVIGQKIRGALKNTECQDVKGRESKEGFDTCSDANSLDNLNALDEIRDPSLDTTETYDQACGGFLGTERDNLWDKFYGANTYQPWNGLVVFERKLTGYRTDSVLADSSNDDGTYKRGPWYGKTIDCTRDEQMRLTCNNVTKPVLSGGRSGSYSGSGSIVPASTNYPWLGRWLGGWTGCYFGCNKDFLISYSYIDQRYYNYLITGVQDGVYLSRKSTINSWANAAALQEGPKSSTNWTLPDEGKQCIWNRKEPALTCDVSVREQSWEGHYAKDTDASTATANRFKSGAPYTYAFNSPAGGLKSYSVVSTLNGYPRTDGGLIVTTFDFGVDSSYIKTESGYRSYGGINAKYLTSINFQYTKCSWGPSGPKCNRVTVFDNAVYRVAVKRNRISAETMAKRYRQNQIFDSLPYRNAAQGRTVDTRLNAVSASTSNYETGLVNRPYQRCKSSSGRRSCWWVNNWVSVKRNNFSAANEFIYSVLTNPGARDNFYKPRLNTGRRVIDTSPELQPTGDYMTCSQQRITQSDDEFYTLYDIRGYQGVGPGGNGDHSPWRMYSRSTVY